MNLITAFGTYFTNLLGFKNSDKLFFQSNSKILGQKGAIYIDIEKPYEIYNENPSINLVVNKKASMFSNMELKLVDKNNKEIIDNDFLMLVSKPNILQSMNDFLKTYSKHKDIYGNSFIYKNVSSSLQKYPTSMSIVSPRYIQPILTGKVIDQTELNEIIKEYEIINSNDKSISKIDTDFILWVRNTDLDDPLVGISPLKSLRYPITNTKLSYDYLNVISSEKGAIGILSDDNRSPMGGMPLRDEEKKSIEDSYSKNYGIGEGQRKVIVTKSALKWTPMSYPTAELQLQEQIDANFLTVVDHFGMNVNLFSSKAQTYENVKNAIIQTYQDTIIPEADLFCQDLTEFLQIQNGYKIVPSYGHVQILKDSQKSDANTIKTASDSLIQLMTNGIITNQQVKEIMNNSFGLSIS